MCFLVMVRSSSRRAMLFSESLFSAKSQPVMLGFWVNLSCRGFFGGWADYFGRNFVFGPTCDQCRTCLAYYALRRFRVVGFFFLVDANSFVFFSRFLCVFVSSCPTGVAWSVRVRREFGKSIHQSNCFQHSICFSLNCLCNAATGCP